jgi:hypothetical protein
MMKDKDDLNCYLPTEQEIAEETRKIKHRRQLQLQLRDQMCVSPPKPTGIGNIREYCAVKSMVPLRGQILMEILD